MGRIHEYDGFIYQSRFHAFFQYPLKDTLEQVGILKAPHVILPEGAEMRHGVAQAEAEEPAVGSVHLDLLNRLPHAPYSEHVLDHRQLDQDHRVKAGASVILAIAALHHLIDEAPVDGVFQLSYEVILRYQLVQACKLNLVPVLSSVPRHHCPRPLASSFYHNKVPTGSAFAPPMGTLSTV